MNTHPHPCADDTDIQRLEQMVNGGSAENDTPITRTMLNAVIARLDYLENVVRQLRERPAHRDRGDE